MRKKVIFVSVLAAVLAWNLGRTRLVSAEAATPEALTMQSVDGQTMESIDAEKIRAHVKFLSSDLLEGRGTGQRGGDIAAEYIATQFALYGLKPAGDHGTFFQDVPMVGVKTLPATSMKLVATNGRAMELANMNDFVTNNESQMEKADIDAPIVFVGFGIKAPEYGWDDYKGVDLKGKVALLFVNEPSSDDPKFFKGKALTYYGRWTYKFEETARRGAVATLIIHRTDLASYGWEVVRNSWGSERSYLKRDGTPKLQAASWIQTEVAKKLVNTAGLDLDKLFAEAQKREFKPVELPVRLQAHVQSALRPFVSKNVLGILPGVDPQRSGEAVLYTAHYDHLGIDAEMKGHNIYNGAMDNASGCGILLELARVWALAPKAPPRSILFASVTAEEQGLLGSEYLGKHSPVPPGKIALDLNYDDVPAIGEPEEVEVSGAERTTFNSVVQATAKEFGFGIRPDPRPEAGHYYRSDHFSLARVGVPSFSINEGIKFKGHPADWGEAQAKDYTEHRYHQPSDQYQPDMDFTGDAAMARFGYALGMKAATMPALVGWQAGDEFEPARKSSQK
ncbi:MAG TPA: M28 family peptidase [Candidatus Dormibacteraeota bacterium]|nr:M28 family peptidase [Candidatus Dormibacteraeota bacterium]